MSYPWLPLEIYVHILSQLEPSASSDISVNALVNCSFANSLIHSATTDSVLWKPHYHIRYTHSTPEREGSRRHRLRDDWRMMYAERRRLDRQALELLESMMVQPEGRLQRARVVAHDLSFDVWDVLDTEAQCAIPRCFRKDDHADVEQMDVVAPHAITRKFWAKAMLGVIARRNAVEMWGHLVHLDLPNVATFEDALSGLSAFFSVSPFQISSTLDALSSRCKAHLMSQGLVVEPAVRGSDVIDICVQICEFLRTEGFRAANSRRFHDLFNHFPHCVLTSNRETLPMSLVWLFVAVARRLGLAASPVDFPQRVLAHVSVPDSGQSDILVDVYGSETKAILSPTNDIPRLLSAAGLHQVHPALRPSEAAPMLLRAARNIVGSFHVMTQGEFDTISQADYESASYASLCADLVLTNNGRALSHLKDPDWPTRLDVGAVLLDTLAPLLAPMNRSILESRCKEMLEQKEDPENLQLRTQGPNGVLYFVGMPFTHVTYAYTGCIVGWQPTCMASEEWIMRMAIDNLSYGRHQPFYNVITLMGSPRYVAQQNIIPLDPTPTHIARSFFEKHSTMGMYFENADLREGGRGRMLLSRELHRKYPEDDNVGARWVRTGELA